MEYKVLKINTDNSSDKRLYRLDNGAFIAMEAYENKMILFDSKNGALKIYEF